MATIKSYTDLEQSKKLAEILPLESADMIYMPMMDIDSMSNSGFFDIPECYPFNEFKDSDTKPLPCWSLAALLSVLKDGALDFANGRFRIYSDGITKYMDNPVDACYEMVIRLHELNLL